MILEIRVPNNYVDDRNIDLQFEEEDEIMFDGKMYDIISQNSSGDSIIFKCISDINENGVRDLAYKEILNSIGRKAGNKGNILLNFNPGLFINFSHDETSFFLSKNFLNMYPGYIIKKISDPFQNIPSPPPWQST